MSALLDRVAPVPFLWMIWKGSRGMGMQQRQPRLEITMPNDQRLALNALAEAAGMAPATLARLGITWLLARRNLLLTGSTAPLHPALERLVGELEQDPRTSEKIAGFVHAALRAVDTEADANPAAAALLAAVTRVAAMPDPLPQRLAALCCLLDTKEITVTRDELRERHEAGA